MSQQQHSRKPFRAPRWHTVTRTCAMRFEHHTLVVHLDGCIAGADGALPAGAAALDMPVAYFRRSRGRSVHHRGRCLWTYTQRLV